MKIPISFYAKFWISTTFAGISTIAIFYFLFPVLAVSEAIFTHPLFLPILLLILQQLHISRVVFGKFRGKFEYYFLENAAPKYANARIWNEYGTLRFIRLLIDEKGFVGLFRDDFYKDILNNEKLMSDPEFRVSIYLKIASSLSKEVAVEKELSFLKQAQEISPENVVVNFRIANACEKQGDGNIAINNYRKLLDNFLVKSSHIGNFISEQINRIETKGPSRKAVYPGLKFSLLGL
jgi:hypothetical protein